MRKACKKRKKRKKGASGLTLGLTRFLCSLQLPSNPSKKMLHWSLSSSNSSLSRGTPLALYKPHATLLHQLWRPLQRCKCHSSTVDAAATTSSGRPGGRPARYAILGAGLAGLATSWHILVGDSLPAPPAPTPPRTEPPVSTLPPLPAPQDTVAEQGGSVELRLFDAHGIAAGGSGAAAGLLHPISPKGKVRRECPDSTSGVPTHLTSSLAV